MKIAAGKSYLTRDGKIVGPLTVAADGAWAAGFVFEVVNPRPAGISSPAWKLNGSYSAFGDAEGHPHDLVAEVLPVSELTLSIVGTVGEVVEAFFALPQYHQEQMLRALLARVAA